jgi:creatine kinase
MAQLTKQEVEAYLASVDLRTPLEEALNAAVTAMTKDPIAFFAAHFASKASSGAAGGDGDVPSSDALFAKVEEIRAAEPGNRCAKYLDKEFYDSLSPEQQAVFYQCVRTGIDNPDSGLGCYAMTPEDYTTFKPFFSKVIGDYHKNDPACADTHTNDWDKSGVGEGGVLDLAKLGLKEELSMRVRVGRNLKAFNLPGKMDKAERIKFEKTALAAFEKLIAEPGYGGRFYSITPDFGDGEENPNKISDEEYNDLVKQHIMFKDMDADPYLKSAGISSDWPYGRGCWVSDDKKKIIWVGEEDQFRIMVMKKGFLINEVFEELEKMLQLVESIDGIDFAKDDQYGYVTSCPSNLGTGMRASVHVKIPNLTSDGTDKKAKEVAGPLGLSVRGTGGEHTPIGADGTVDISPRARLFIKEAEIIQALYDGLKALLEAEAKAKA